MADCSTSFPPVSPRLGSATVDCKPGPVPAPGCPEAGEDHSSRRRVAAPLERSHPDTGRRSSSGGPPSTVPLFELAPGGACSAAGHPAVARGLLPHDFTLTCASSADAAGHRRCHFCCAFPRVAPGRCCRSPCPVEPGLSSRGRCLSAGDPPSTSSTRAILAGAEAAGRPQALLAPKAIELPWKLGSVSTRAKLSIQ